MVTATKGVLLTCDEAMKQFLLKLDREYRIGLIDLDEHHVMIPGGKDDKIMALIQEKMDALLEENSFRPDILEQQTSEKLDETTEPNKNTMRKKSKK
jgi:hypothetical protein